MSVNQVPVRAISDMREELLLAAFDQVEVSAFHREQIGRYLHDNDVDTVRTLSMVLLELSRAGLIRVYSVSDAPDQDGQHAIKRLDQGTVQTRCDVGALTALFDAPADQSDDLWVKLTDEGATAIG